MVHIPVPPELRWQSEWLLTTRSLVRSQVEAYPGVAQLVEQWTVKCACAAIHWSAVQICLPGVTFVLPF